LGQPGRDQFISGCMGRERESRFHIHGVAQLTAVIWLRRSLQAILLVCISGNAGSEAGRTGALEAMVSSPGRPSGLRALVVVKSYN
jgi:hypothetical protein